MKKRVLIVDDEEIFVEALTAHILERGHDYSIHAASNGKEALEILKKERVDLLILDINMPVMDGIELLVELRNRKIWMPVIVLSNVVVLSDERSDIFEEFVVVDYIEKPVNLERLDRKIDEIINPGKQGKLAADYEVPQDNENRNSEDIKDNSVDLVADRSSPFISLMEAELKKFVGDSAENIIVKKIQDLGYDPANRRHFPPSHEIDLVEKVSEEIKEKTEVIQFKRKMIEYFKKKRESKDVNEGDYK